MPPCLVRPRMVWRLPPKACSGKLLDYHIGEEPSVVGRVRVLSLCALRQRVRTASWSRLCVWIVRLQHEAKGLTATDVKAGDADERSRRRRTSSSRGRYAVHSGH